jgi:hypothetical protein
LLRARNQSSDKSKIQYTKIIASLDRQVREIDSADRANRLAGEDRRELTIQKSKIAFFSGM